VTVKNTDESTIPHDVVFAYQLLQIKPSSWSKEGYRTKEYSLWGADLFFVMTVKEVPPEGSG
jgi:hypothetical protein